MNLPAQGDRLLSPSRERLLACLSTGTEPSRGDELGRLSAEDWTGVAQQGVMLGVAPLLYYRLQGLGPGTSVPPKVRLGLREMYLHSAGAGMRLHHQLAQVLTALQGAEVPAIALKGAHLAEVVYGDTALRPMSDIDLLVKRPDLSRAEDALREIGYTPHRPFWVEAESDMHHHLPRFTRPGSASVEVHWTLVRPTDPFDVDENGLWSRARPATIAGAQALVLSPEDLLLHQCLHMAFGHRFRVGLRPLCDVAEILRHYREETDWKQTADRARQWNADRCAYLVLRIAREWLSAAVPHGALQALEPHDLDPKFVLWTKEEMLSAPDSTPSLHADFAQMWGTRRLRAKVSLFARHAFPSPKALSRAYPVPPSSRRIYLYYLVHLRDLLFRYAKTAWRLLRRDEQLVAVAKRKERGNILRDWLTAR